MANSKFAQAEAWESTKRIWITVCLALSAIQTWALAFVIGLRGSGDDHKLLAAGLLLFGGLAIAVALGFRKLRQLSWKHWLVVVVLAAPGAIAALSSALAAS
jgi:membrane protease YdiL (CAAX protease family)